AELHGRFGARRDELLRAREERQPPKDFLEDTREIREDTSWRVPPPRPDYEDRRVEITGPTDRKLAINALNSGAKGFITFSEDALGVPKGTMRATVLIETLPAAFQMQEILWELREHSYGLNAGRWDYIFSMIKSYRDDASFVLPDRVKVTMTVPFMRAYT